MAHATPNFPKATFCNVIGLLENHLQFIILTKLEKTVNMQC